MAKERSKWITAPLAMTIGEITHEFRTAKHPANMVGVLADLNNTKPSRIWWLLHQCGLPVDLRTLNKVDPYEDTWYQMHGAECARVKQILMEVEETEMNEQEKVVGEAAPERETPQYRVKLETVSRVDKSNGCDYVVSLLWDVYLNRLGVERITPDMVGDMKELMKLGELAAGIMEGKR